MEIIQNINEKETCFIDTAPLIYFFEKNEVYFEKINEVFNDLYEKNCQIVVSMITYIEISTLPVKLGNLKLAAKYREYFTNSNNLTLYPVNLLISEKTISYRAKYNLKTPDAIQLATAEICGADYVLSNDKEWSKINEVNVILIDDL